MDQFSSHPLYRKHNLDSVMSSLWEFYKKNFAVLFLCSLLVSLVVQYMASSFNFYGLDLTDPVAVIEKIKGLIWPMIVISLISLLFTVIIHYYIIYNPVDSRVSIFVSVYRSLIYFIPFLIILIIFAFAGSFAMVLGFFALIIGMLFVALYIGTLFLFILPILMVEGNNIGHAISRTFILTHRNFWPNIGWVAVIVLILIVFTFIISSVIIIPFSGSFLKVMSNPEEATNILNFTSNPIYIIASALVNAFTFPVLPLLGIILYFNGKAGEEVTGDLNQNLTT